ncbi:MAG: recombinase family protein [Chloroflexi bacterium]|nr:recombinase family protein [Chloroflexota bacterium]
MKTQQPGNRVVAYTRVSDPSQVEGHSLDAQKADIIRWCQRRDYEFISTYVEDGKSARSERIERRPRIMALLEDAKAGQFDIVVVHTIDRWSRNVGVQRQALQMLGDAGVGFASVMEDFDFTTPGGKLMLTMMGGVAEFFSDQLAVHVSKAQRYRASIGLPVGPVPFGYFTPDPGGVPQISEIEAAAVREVFGRRAGGESTGSLADWLNSAGFKTRKGGIFTSHAVKDMLNCRFYLGKVRYNTEEYPGQHQAIIKEDLYQMVQARKQHRAIIRTVQGPKGLLQGIISCGNCGKGIQSDRHRYGGAMYRERHSQRCATNGRSMMARKVDQQIQDVITSMELRPQWREEMIRLAAVEIEGPNPHDLQEKRRRISRAYADGAFNDREYEAKLAEIDAQIRLTFPMDLPTLEETASLFGNITQIWEEATPEEKRKLLSPLIERVYVDVEYSMIGAIVPVPAFRRLLEGAMSRAESPAAVLLSEDESERLKVWSWWRRGRLEKAMARVESAALTLHSPDETDRLQVWSWWRRGRVELPVQKAL